MSFFTIKNINLNEYLLFQEKTEVLNVASWIWAKRDQEYTVFNVVESINLVLSPVSLIKSWPLTTSYNKI